MKRVLPRVFSRGTIDYARAKSLAADQDPKRRRALAGRTDVQPEILYYLAEDPAPEVRRAIAANRATPIQADLLLAGDSDADVRCGVAGKIARIAPDLTDDERVKIGAVVVEILDTLARDQLPRVRRILSEELKDAKNVPAGVIERLARDDDPETAAPVLEYSPLLPDAVLIEIIDSRPVRGILGAIARRRDLRPDVSDAIVQTDETEVITALLSNKSAQVREETLDALVERAPGVAAWHAPLVGRPVLSARAVKRLSTFVAESLVGTLLSRRDIDPDTAAAVSAAVRERIEQDPAEESPGLRPEDPEERAQRLHREEALYDETIMAALGRGERAFVVAALALRAGLTRTAVQKAASLESAKGITAIAWKAGMPMTDAVELQLRLARISPLKVLRPRSEGAYPLSEDEMAWQLEFFGS